jgi:hypothetical protein
MRSVALAITAIVASGVSGACGPSASEIRTAKTATYNADANYMFELANEVTSETYKVADVDAPNFTFVTLARHYGPEGDLQSPGAEGWVHLQDRSVVVAFIVKVIPTADKQVAVTVTPKTFQYLHFSPQPRQLMPDDPNLPPWVLGRAEALTLAIYNRAKKFVAAAPGAH